ncbi:hypothetical protein AYI70_g618 [Smittium culicis]|uniref:Uncharacterized protein n=1 Tax=Smittium culicis TaxID=133412 RepID=A0A1R1YG06_9FUNG|nr:hypothetical protein AYI70_g618 [Smittium culicis]
MIRRPQLLPKNFNSIPKIPSEVHQTTNNVNLLILDSNTIINPKSPSHKNNPQNLQINNCFNTKPKIKLKRINMHQEDEYRNSFHNPIKLHENHFLSHNPSEEILGTNGADKSTENSSKSRKKSKMSIHSLINNE